MKNHFISLLRPSRRLSTAILKLLFVFMFAAPQGSLAQGEQDMQLEPAKGIHGGRLLQQGDLQLELSIFEKGVPPEFRVWAKYADQNLDPSQLDLQIKLIRLADGTDVINFAVEGDYLRGDTAIYEPHSFIVDISAQVKGKRYHWRYDNFEGRVQISNKVTQALEINTAIAGEKTFARTLPVFGRMVLPPQARRLISARFPGEIKQLKVAVGDSVQAGQTLAVIESNESLKTYALKAPISGVVSQRFANPGEQSLDQPLLELVNNEHLWLELQVFAGDRDKLKLGQPIRLSNMDAQNSMLDGLKIDQIAPVLAAKQTTKVRAKVDNRQLQLAPGAFVQAEIEFDRFEVDLAVASKATQSFRDFTVVYIKVGEQYEVRMLELGRRSGSFVEVLSGLKAGSEYVIDNSFIIKADIDKSGASHDH